MIWHLVLLRHHRRAARRLGIRRGVAAELLFERRQSAFMPICAHSQAIQLLIKTR